jgi:hypothetical protein
MKKTVNLNCDWSIRNGVDPRSCPNFNCVHNVLSIFCDQKKGNRPRRESAYDRLDVEVEDFQPDRYMTREKFIKKHKLK